MCRTSLKSCSHLEQFYRQKHAVKPYTSLQKFLKTGPVGRKIVNRDNLPVRRCDFCSGHQGKMYLCLICSYVSCYFLPDSDHALLHSQSGKGHEIAVDMDRLELFCFICFDQIYDPDFDRIVTNTNLIDIPRNSNDSIALKESLNKRRRVMRNLRLKSSFPPGLRGLNNLGSTCFLNSVLQVLLHIPPLQNFFLNNRHDPEICRKNSSKRLCLACDMVDLFSEIFSGERSPYSPARFLYSWWQHSENLANYEQQDAHELFISLLDQIHEKVDQNSTKSKGSGDCQCVAHRVFSGVLRSDVICGVCGFTSTTCDPCMDISLVMDSNMGSPQRNELPNKTSISQGISTLEGSLDLFTRTEKLGSDQKLYCQQCKIRQDSLKQMSIKRLPMVLCFHVKRFEHSFVRKKTRKVDQYLQFPFSLDMTPYLSSSIIRNRSGPRTFALECDESDISTELSSGFEVFAVITHSGQLESGHYVTYLRLCNEWYRCDDAWITGASERDVRESQVYLIYYLQNALYNKVNEDSYSYVYYHQN